MTRLLILRPQPGADQSAERARRAGFDVTLCPLFSVQAVAWTPPNPTQFDALMLTSANAVRHSGGQLALYAHLPAFTVGAATAQAAREAGLAVVHSGEGDADAVVGALHRAGHRNILHICGRDVRSVDAGALNLMRVIVYASEECACARELLAALHPETIIMVHSPRAGKRMATLLPEATRGTVDLIAISPAALNACGSGWRRAFAAPRPDDGAMLALAEQMCQ